MSLQCDFTLELAPEPNEHRSSKQVLLFAYDFPPSVLTGARRPFRLVKYLKHYGYDAHVITREPQLAGAPWQDVVEVSGNSPSRLARIGSKAGAALQRVLPYNDELPWVVPAVCCAYSAADRVRPHVIISTSPPVGSHLAAAVTSRLLRRPWVADFRDPLHGNPGRCRRWGWIWDAPVERIIISLASAIIANTDTAADMLKRRYPFYSRKIHVLWNGYDPEEQIEPRPIPQREHAVLLHAGVLYGPRHPGVLLESLFRLVSTGRVNPQTVRVRLIGEVDIQQAWLKSFSFHRLVELGCIEQSTGLVPAGEAAKEIAEADYLLLLDLHERAGALQVPAKLFEYVQVGRPILAFTPQNSPSERILAKSGVPYICVHPNSKAEEVDAGLLSLLAMPSQPARPSPWFYQQFDADRQACTLRTILDALS